MSNVIRLVLSVGFLAAQLSAGLIGDTVQVGFLAEELEFPLSGSGTPIYEDVLVTGGIEFVCTLPGSGICAIGPSGSFTLDIGETTITESRTKTSNADGQWSPAKFTGWVFNSLDMGSPITGVTLTHYGMVGLDDSRVSFNANTVWLNLQDVIIDSRESGWTLQLALGASSTVPEPGTATMAGIGILLIILGGLGRRRVAENSQSSR